jgi:hypothetical protein
VRGVQAQSGHRMRGLEDWDADVRFATVAHFQVSADVRAELIRLVSSPSCAIS